MLIDFAPYPVSIIEFDTSELNLDFIILSPIIISKSSSYEAKGWDNFKKLKSVVNIKLTREPRASADSESLELLSYPLGLSGTWGG